MFVLACGSAVLVLVIIRQFYNRGKSTHTSDAGKILYALQTIAVMFGIVKKLNVCEILCSMLLVFSLETVLQTRNVEYDEVVLSPTTASIPTEHNKAYVTTTPIPTDQNVAYGVHSTNT